MSSATVSRQDIHRPSSEDFDPENYEYVRVYDLSGIKTIDPVLVSLEKDGKISGSTIFAPHQQHRRCGHCGARLRYAAVLKHVVNDDLLLVGQTCLAGRFANMTKHAFQQARKEARLQKVREASVGRLELSCENDPILALLTYPEITDDHSSFVRDVASQFKNNGVLSVAQKNAVVRALDNELAFRLKEERKEEEQRQQLIDGAIIMAPSGDTVIRGVIEKVSLRHNEAYGSSAWKMTVKDYDGFQVWSTLSRPFIQAFIENNPGKTEEDLVGESIIFSASLTRSRDNPYFAFAKRAKKFYLV